MKNRVFEYIIYFDPNETKYKDKEVPKAKILVTDVTLAPDIDKAKIIASRSIPEDFVDKLDEVEIAIRPF